jgi:glutathione S-transferase
MQVTTTATTAAGLAVGASDPAYMVFYKDTSFADAYALTLLRWGGMAGIDPASLPAYRAYSARLALEPAVAAAIAREGISLDSYKPAKA